MAATDGPSPWDKQFNCQAAVKEGSTLGGGYSPEVKLHQSTPPEVKLHHNTFVTLQNTGPWVHGLFT